MGGGYGRPHQQDDYDDGPNSDDGERESENEHQNRSWS